MIGPDDRGAIALLSRVLTATAQAWAAFLLLILVLAATARSAAAQSRIQDYQNYCADCHGLGGKGDGPSRLTIPMNPPPTDLTQMAKKNGGQFPFDRGRGLGRRPQEYTVARATPDAFLGNDPSETGQGVYAREQCRREEKNRIDGAIRRAPPAEVTQHASACPLAASRSAKQAVILRPNEPRARTNAKP